MTYYPTSQIGHTGQNLLERIVSGVGASISGDWLVLFLPATVVHQFIVSFQSTNFPPFARVFLPVSHQDALNLKRIRQRQPEDVREAGLGGHAPSGNPKPALGNPDSWRLRLGQADCHNPGCSWYTCRRASETR
ncbi:hypothetical protein GE061_012196 [Apolygus lucorum]|uniref:Uncharacterized protein n=1 Tax=Apolygus lucorum TaxID=248454 RepID=A0A8S9XRJ4_APOLU|nr:hypothetical protein GE061_012196 [Apolygus lucorum]